MTVNWIKRLIVLGGLFLASASCGTSNIGDCPSKIPFVSCTKSSTDEAIRKALDDGDLASARTLLESAIADDPDNYQRYPLLAAVYAGLSGFDLVSVASSANSSGGATSLLDAMDAFLPAPAGKTRAEYVASVDLMGLAATTLANLPASFLASSDTDKYAASASQQLGIYQAAHASMYMKLFTYNFDTGSADTSQLSSLSAADASTIMTILTSAAGGNGPFASVAASTLAAINSGGGTDRDNLANFLGGHGS